MITQNHEQRKHVDKFKTEFALQFGYFPSVNLEERESTSFTDYTLESLKELVDSHTIDLHLDDVSRKRSLVILRTIYCMLAADLGHTYKSIGDQVKRDHTTVIYNIKSGYDLLETDKEFQQLYMKISSLVDPKIYPHARINEITDEASANSQSAGSSRMHSRKYNITRPSPRTKGGSRIPKRKTVH